MKIRGIYKISSKINGMFYIGSAIDFGQRIRKHLSDLRFKKHHSILLQRHCNKYGIESLSFSLIEPVMFKDDLIKREQLY